MVGRQVGMHTVSTMIVGMTVGMFIDCGDDWGDAHSFDNVCGDDCGDVYRLWG